MRAELSALRTQSSNLRAESSSKATELTRILAELAERDKLIAERDKLIAERDKLIAERDKLIAERDKQLVEQGAKVEDAGKAELTGFEQQLLERGSEIRRLEQDLRTAERTGRELVRELARRGNEQSALASGELERALAEREADLQAAAWTIESLSLRLELAGNPVRSDAPPAETALPSEEAR